MTNVDYQNILDGMIDELASIEHERWSHWQKYMHGKGVRQSDGSLLIPADLVARWDEQISKGFSQLTEEERDSDREQVRRYVPAIVSKLEKASQ